MSTLSSPFFFHCSTGDTFGYNVIEPFGTVLFGTYWWYRRITDPEVKNYPLHVQGDWRLKCREVDNQQRQQIISHWWVTTNELRGKVHVQHEVHSVAVVWHMKTTPNSDMGTNYNCVCYVLREDSSAGLLVEFHQHVTGLHVLGRIACIGHPSSVRAHVEVACAAWAIPPAALTIYSAASTRHEVIVAVWSAEHFSVGFPIGLRCRDHRITGVSAVPGHRQSVLTNLITDGERRVFSRVPQTRSTLDLSTYMHTLQLRSNVGPNLSSPKILVCSFLLYKAIDLRFRFKQSAIAELHIYFFPLRHVYTDYFRII